VTLRNGALEVEGGSSLQGRVRVPGDKSISHRAILIGAMAEGTSKIRGLSDGDDVARTARAVTELGAEFDGENLRGGLDRLHEPSGPLDLGNSGTSMRLLAGLLASRPWRTELIGDESLSNRPMDRVAHPLRRMGASVDGFGQSVLPPLTITGGPLEAIDYKVPVASAQVKSCVLLAGVCASGRTVVREPVLTRTHTEELLGRCGANIHEEFEAVEAVQVVDVVHVVRVRASKLKPFTLEVPGDPSQAAFWTVAATVVSGSNVVLERVYVGPARRGFIEILRRMGASIEETATTTPDDLAETADLTVSSAPLQATEISSEEIPSLDEVPALAVAASLASGTTVFRDVAELRVKESDRLIGVAAMVNAFGARAEVEGDNLFVHGASSLNPARVDSGGDHRIAMAAAVAGLAAPKGSSTVIDGWGAVSTSYPGFSADLASLGGQAGEPG